MVWSQLSIVVHFGIHFGNSVLDNSNRDKVSHSLTPICGRWGTTQNFILAFIDELWKTWKIRLLKNEKICWTYHFTHVYQKPITWGTVSEIWIETGFFSFWVFLCPFNPLPSPLTIQKNKILKRKNHLEMSSFYTSTTKNTIIWCMLTQIWSAHIIFCHFRPVFVLLPHYRPWKLKFWKNIKKHQEISFYTCVPLIRIICTPDMVPVWFLRYEVQQTESLWIVLKILKIKKNP